MRVVAARALRSYNPGTKALWAPAVTALRLPQETHP